MIANRITLTIGNNYILSSRESPKESLMLYILSILILIEDIYW